MSLCTQQDQNIGINYHATRPRITWYRVETKITGIAHP